MILKQIPVTDSTQLHIEADHFWKMREGETKQIQWELFEVYLEKCKSEKSQSFGVLVLFFGFLIRLEVIQSIV